MIVALTTIGSRGVTLAAGPSALREAPDGVAVVLTLYDGPLVLTLTRDQVQAITADITAQLGESGKAT